MQMAELGQHVDDVVNSVVNNASIFRTTMSFVSYAFLVSFTFTRRHQSHKNYFTAYASNA